MKRLLSKRLWLLVLPLLASGCQTDSPIEDLLQGRQIEYAKDEYQSGQSLQYPPDLLSTAQAVEGTVSLSEYAIESVAAPAQPQVAVDAPAAKVAYRRSGRLRWVEVDLPPGQVWPLARSFWSEHLGFDLHKEQRELGTMETGWLDLRERITAPGILNDYLHFFINRLNDSGERDKFATRLERNEAGGTDVYVAHRHVAAQFDKDALFTGYESQGSDPQLEVEMMRRLMLYIAGRSAEGEGQGSIGAQIAAAEAVADSDYRLEGAALHIYKPFDESWQLVQVGLDRGGFSIEDRDYQEGVIYIRHSGGPDSDRIFGKAESPGFFSRLLGKKERPVLREIRLVFHREGGGQVRLTALAGAAAGDPPLTDAQAGAVLELLHQYLP